MLFDICFLDVSIKKKREKVTYLELYLILKEENLFDEFVAYMQKNVLIQNSTFSFFH